MLLNETIDEFFNGYFSTHERSAKTKVAYRSDLDQVAEYAPRDLSLEALNPCFIEGWASDLRAGSTRPLRCGEKWWSYRRLMADAGWRSQRDRFRLRPVKQ